MKIALFVHCFFPRHFYGTETYTLNLAQHLQQLGHQPVVITAIFPGEPGGDQLIQRYEYQGVPVIAVDKNHLPNIRVQDTYYQPAVADVYREILQQERVDLVHVTHLINHTATLLQVLNEMSIKTVATFTDFFGICFNNKLENAAGELCAGPNATRSNCVACYGKAVAQQGGAPSRYRIFASDEWAEKAAALAVKMRHMPPVRGSHFGRVIRDLRVRPQTLLTLYDQYSAVITPTSFLQNAYKRNGFRLPMHSVWFGTDIDRTLGKSPRPEGVVRFGYIGQIAPHKGTDLLVDALARLPAGNATLDIYGPRDQDIAYFDRLSASFGERVRYHGTFPKSEMARVLSNIDVIVIPSRWYENSPLVLLDALATGTPVIVSDVEGMTEMVSEGETGLFFERGSCDDLTRKMNRFVSEDGLLEFMRRNTAFPRTVADMVRDTEAVYQTVIRH
jgi:glycosyltransferase involved in cell wall biosynthesis